MANFAKRFLGDESGATAIEYGLIAALISIAIIAACAAIGAQIAGRMDKVAGCVETNTTAACGS